MKTTEARSKIDSPADRVLPDGVMLRALSDCGDHAVDAIELFCKDWTGGPAPIQWNFVRSEPNSLRGVHVHSRHWDYLCVLAGEMLLGLHDLRPSSPTHLYSTLQVLRGDQPRGISIPPGVAHGFYFAAPAKYVYGTSEYWNVTDELGCMWNDPQLRLDWPAIDPILSVRDRGATSYSDMVRALAEVARPGPAAP